MADVTDVITKLSLTTDTKGGEQQLAVIDANIKAVDQNAASITRLEGIRDKTDKANLARINQLNAAIDNRKRKIEQETTVITKQIQTNEKLRTSLAKQGISLMQAGDRLDRFGRSSTTASQALQNLGRVAQDAPYGFIGIANNLNPLIESFQRLRLETGSNMGALKALGTSLTGAGGLGIAISIVSSLLVVFGDKLFRSSEAADAANESYKEFLKTIASDTNSSIRAINEQSNRARLLYNVIRQGGKQGAAAMKELREEYPAITKDLKDADIAAGKGLNSILKQVKAKEVGNLASKTQVELQSQLIEQQRQLSAATDKDAAAQARLKSAQIAFNSAIGDRQEAAFNVLQRAQKEADAAKISVNDAARSVENFKKRIGLAGSLATAGFVASTDLQKGSEPEKPKKEKKDKVRDALRLPAPDDLAELEKEANDLLQLKNFIDEIYGTSPSSLDPSNLIGGGNETPESRKLRAQLEIQKDVKEKQIEDDKDLEQRKKASLERIKDNYRDAAQTIIGVIQSIYDRQIALLDNEIAIRRDRVAQAVELAQRGNTEILKQEQERLNEAQKTREEIARKQLQINSLLQASSAAIAATQAIQVVTNAGATGDPYSTAARIAAAVAALAAGFAFVANLTQAFKVDAFKDGVVDYQGKGTGTSDSNTVRISHGESVITAKATQQYKPILEMMNKGIPLPVSMFYPSSNKSDNKSLERRLDALIALQQGNGIDIQTKVSNGEIATIVQSQRRLQQRTWNG